MKRLRISRSKGCASRGEGIPATESYPLQARGAFQDESAGRKQSIWRDRQQCVQREPSFADAMRAAWLERLPSIFGVSVDSLTRCWQHADPIPLIGLRGRFLTAAGIRLAAIAFCQSPQMPKLCIKELNPFRPAAPAAKMSRLDKLRS